MGETQSVPAHWVMVVLPLAVKTTLITESVFSTQFSQHYRDKQVWKYVLVALVPTNPYFAQAYDRISIGILRKSTPQLIDTSSLTFASRRTLNVCNQAGIDGGTVSEPESGGAA